MQALGTQAFLRRHGHEPVFVHCYSQQLENANRKRKPVKDLRSAAYAAAYSLMRPALERRFERFNLFFDKHFSITDRYYSYEELKDSPPEFDAYICGSDQIWRFDGGMSEYFFLRFVDEDVKAIAYAPSFGHNALEVEPPEELASWINRFQYLSTREPSGREAIRKLTGRDAPVVMDPVFLLKPSDWLEYSSSSSRIEGPYILFYALEFNPLVSEVVRSLMKTTGMKVVVIGKAGGIVFSPKTQLALDAGPDEFLNLLRKASLVVTNSFHATVFSIMFNRPFVTIRHSARNERIEHLLRMAGVPERLIKSSEDLALNKLKDYLDEPGDLINGALAEPISESQNFLRSALSAIKSTDGINN